MSEAVLNELPDIWEWSTLGDVCEKPQYGWTTKASQEGDLHLLRTTDITSGQINWDTVPYCVLEPEDKEKYLIKDGDIVVSRAGSVGVSYLISNPEPSVFASYLIRFKPLIDRKYVFYFLKSPAYWNAISEKSAGIALQNVNASKLKEINIPVAPPEQQKRIVAKIEELFSHIDAGTEALKKAKQLLKQYRQSVLKAAVTGELTKEWREANKGKLEPANKLLERILKDRRQKWEEQQLEQFKSKGKMPKDDKWKKKYPEPYISDELMVPSEWVTASLDQLTEYITSGSRGWAKFYSDAGATFIRAQNLKYDYLKLDNIAYVDLPDKAEGMRTRVKYGDLLITITGANVTKTGYVNIELDEAYVSQHVALCRPIMVKCTKYLYTYLISKDGARKTLEGAAYGAGKPGLNLNNLKTLQIALPSVKEQEEIVRLVDEKLESANHLSLEIDAQILKAEKNKQSILVSAFYGRLVENEHVDESSSVLLERITKEKVLAESKAKLEKKRVTTKKATKMAKKSIIEVLKDAGKPLGVDEIFEHAGYASKHTTDNVEDFYNELKVVAESNEVEVTQVLKSGKKQGDIFSYKA